MIEWPPTIWNSGLPLCIPILLYSPLVLAPLPPAPDTMISSSASFGRGVCAWVAWATSSSTRRCGLDAARDAKGSCPVSLASRLPQPQMNLIARSLSSVRPSCSASRSVGSMTVSSASTMWAQQSCTSESTSYLWPSLIKCHRASGLTRVSWSTSSAYKKCTKRFTTAMSKSLRSTGKSDCLSRIGTPSSMRLNTEDRAASTSLCALTTCSPSPGAHRISTSVACPLSRNLAQSPANAWFADALPLPGALRLWMPSSRTIIPLCTFIESSMTSESSTTYSGVFRLWSVQK
mmetsp:Transcript_72521/g.205579  ORF Transcript_72521/g.205579 Transcript_72521/m.205579 type:complete len:290 (-) Transcript_72521:435-1304(-)